MNDTVVEETESAPAPTRIEHLDAIKQDLDRLAARLLKDGQYDCAMTAITALQAIELCQDHLSEHGIDEEAFP
jgi:hypothetical protein